MSNTGPNQKVMNVGKMHRGEVWTDILRWERREVRIDRHGNGVFACPGWGVSVYVRKGAEGMEGFGRLYVYPSDLVIILILMMIVMRIFIRFKVK